MDKILKFHEKGKIGIKIKVPLETKQDLAIAYTPGVAKVSELIHKDKSKVYNYTSKQNSVAIVTDGSAVLGLGNIGPEAALPVMEGKAILFKKFANIDAFPICLKTQDVDEIVTIVKNIAPTFGAINLEDISSPRCFEIEEKLKKELDIPVFHDDQHGTSIVVFAALINALKLVKKELKDIKITVNGAGAAGIDVVKLLYDKVKDIISVDSKGIIYKGRKENMNKPKTEISQITNKENLKGSLKDAIKNSDVFIGVSTGNILKEEMIKSMNKDPIVFAMSNPIPEIMPDKAKKAGAKVIGTGRSDFPNQINNLLAFPGVLKGALEKKDIKINKDVEIAAAKAIASLVKDLNENNIIPDVFNKDLVKKVSEAVKKC